MGEDWDFYALRVDSEPASIYTNLALAETAPISAQSSLAYVRVKMRKPRPDGLSSNEESRTLFVVEDALVGNAVQNGITTYVGRNTSGGNRDFYFYTAMPAAFEAAAEAVMNQLPDYKFEIGGRSDPDWKAYFEFLYPSASDRDRIMNRRVTDILAAKGDNLSASRAIDHLAYLPSIGAASILRGELRGQGFVVEEPSLEDGSFKVVFKRTDRPDRIDDIQLPIARRVRELGGKYDGWGCELAK